MPSSIHLKISISSICSKNVFFFSSLAGYDIRESVKIWERMKEAYKGQEIPEWMSAHPSSAKRIQSLKNWIPEVIIEYPPIKKL